MKQLPFSRPASLLLLLGLTPLVSCDDDESLTEKLTYNVELRVSGDNLSGLGAGFTATSTLHLITDPKPGPGVSDVFVTNASKTYELGKFGLQDKIDVTLAYKNVTCSSAIQPASNSKLRVEMLVNGVPWNYVELSSTATNASQVCSPFMMVTLVGESEDFD